MPNGAHVSVVLPCWRCAATVRRAVASVLSQTIAPREIILVDDGNTDDTPAVLRQLASSAPNVIRVVTLNENRGPGEARNAGWDAARGELIALLDADDAWHPRKLELHLGWLALQSGVVMSGHRSVLCRDGEGPPPVAAQFGATRAKLGQILFSNPFQTRTMIINRELPLRFAGRHSEDYALWLRVVASGAPSYVLEVPLACTFRAEFSGTGQSSALWTHERGELAAISALRRAGDLNVLAWSLASGWSLFKFVRRLVLRSL